MRKTLLLSVFLLIILSGFVLAEENSCIDTDGGKNPLEKGQTYTNGSTGDNIHLDYCDTATLGYQFVVEWYCAPAGGSAGLPTIKSIECIHSCSNGTCIVGSDGKSYREIASCVGEKEENKYEKSSITLNYNDGYQRVFTDECVTQIYHGNTQKGLKEYICTTEGAGTGENYPSYSSQFIECNCVDGRCLKDSEILSLPDLTPTRFKINIPDGELVEGDNAYVSVSVKNYGKRDISLGEKEWTIIIYLDGKQINEFKETYAPVGENTAFGETFWIYGLEAGDHIIKVEVDKENNIQELNDQNNILEKKIIVVPSKFKVDYFFVKDKADNYIFYVKPSYPQANINDIYITVVFHGHQTASSGGEKRQLEITRGVSNNPTSSGPTELTYDSDLHAYKTVEISSGELKEIFEDVSIILNYGNERRNLNVSVSKIPIKQVVNPNENKTAIVIPERSADINEVICAGCSLEGKCYPFGYRKSSQYCSDNYNFTKQLGAEAICDNNFECSSNVCISNRCVNPSLIDKILNWFKRLFGAELI